MNASTTSLSSVLLIEQGIAAKELLMLIGLCALRVYAALLVLPATNDQLLMGVVRNGLVLTIATFVALGQPAHLMTGLGASQLLVVGLKEAFVGMLIGFACSVVFWTAEAVGMLIDNIAGFNSVQQNNPLSGQQSTPVGGLLAQLAVVCFYVLGGMTVFVGLLLDSYRWWPLAGVLPDAGRFVEGFVAGQVAGLFETALKVAGPVVVTLMLIDLGIGLLARAAEKLEPTSLGQPIKAATAVLMLVLLLSVFFDQARSELSMRPQARRLEILHAAPAPPRAASAPSR